MSGSVPRDRYRDLVVRGVARGVRVPLATPTRSLQERGDGPVVIPGHTWGRLRSANVNVQVFPGDELAWLSGRHPGALVSGLHHVVREARHPSGLTATLRAPARAAEPVLCEQWEPERQRQLT